MPDLLSTLLRLFGREPAPVERFPAPPACVSSALDVEAGPHDKLLRDALAAVDAVHQDGRLPKIPLRRPAMPP